MCSAVSPGSDGRGRPESPEADSHHVQNAKSDQGGLLIERRERDQFF